MKKIFIILLFMNVFGFIHGQYYPNLDTITGRNCRYHYSEWYDECDWFYSKDSSRFEPFKMTVVGKYIKENYTDHPIKIQGVAIMLSINRIYANHFYEDFGLVYDTLRAPEYAMIYQYDAHSTDSIRLLSSVRWDTVTPKILRLPTLCESCNRIDTINHPRYVFCYLYEAIFNNPVSVDSVFYVGSTNSSRSTFIEEWNQYAYNHLPIVYYSLQPVPRNKCEKKYKVYYKQYDNDSIWQYRVMFDNEYGQFLPILSGYNLDVIPSTDSIGTTSGGGYLPDSTWYQIGAHPKPGYRFSHWNDSVTDNPRQVFLLSDTTFTAYFEEGGVFSVDATCNNDEWGHVNGSGIYPENSIVELDAVAEENCLFVVWSDSVTDNPRFVTVTCDTVFTALFDTVSTSTIHSAESGNGLRVSPNPVHGKLCIEVDEDGEHVAEIFDMVGTLVLKNRFSGHRKEIDTKRLAKGRYILRVTCAKGRSSRPFVVE